MSPRLILVLGGIANLALVGGILAIVFTTVARRTRRRIEHAMAELRTEGVVLEGGPYRGWVHFRNYRRPGYRVSRAVSGTKQMFVLTQNSFAMLGRWSERIPSADLQRYTVAQNADGRLVIATDAPVIGEGHVEWRLAVPDADTWLSKLRDAGMRIAA